MHTCIAYSLGIILTPCFATIIDSSGYSCILEKKGGRLVRTISSPYSIATSHTVEEMEQQKGKWFMNNLRAMIQDEIKQALNGLIPLPAVEMTLVDDIVQPTPTISPAVFSPITTYVPADVPHVVVNPPVVDAPPTNNDNVGGQTLYAAINVPPLEMKFENVGDYMIEKAKKESLELVQELESKQMKALTHKMSKMEELMRGQGIGYSFNFDGMMNTEGDKLPDKFKMPQLQKFDSIEDPIIHLSQYTTTMSTTKAPLLVVTRLFVLFLEGMAINWYHGLTKSIRADWKELCSTFLK